MRVKRFFYDGLFVHCFPGYADYTAEFLRWTEDPGIAVCTCSDGVERLIPTCQLEGFNEDDYPEQSCEEAHRVTDAGNFYIGMPCYST